MQWSGSVENHMLTIPLFLFFKWKFFLSSLSFNFQSQVSFHSIVSSNSSLFFFYCSISNHNLQRQEDSADEEQDQRLDCWGSAHLKEGNHLERQDKDQWIFWKRTRQGSKNRNRKVWSGSGGFVQASLKTSSDWIFVLLSSDQFVSFPNNLIIMLAPCVCW